MASTMNTDLNVHGVGGNLLATVQTQNITTINGLHGVIRKAIQLPLATTFSLIDDKGNVKVEDADETKEDTAYGATQGMQDDMLDDSDSNQFLNDIAKRGAVGFLEERRLLLLTQDAEAISFWNIHGRRLISFNSGPVKLIATSLNGNYVAAIPEDNARDVRIFNTSTDKSPHILRHDGDAHALEFSPTELLIATTEDIAHKANIHLWQVTTGELLMNFSSTKRCLDLMSFSSTGQMLASSILNADIMLLVIPFEVLTKSGMHTPKPSDFPITLSSFFTTREIGNESDALSRILFSPDDLWLLTRLHGNVMLWSVAEIRSGTKPTGRSFKSIYENSFSPDSSKFLTFESFYVVYIIGCETGTLINRLNFTRADNKHIATCLFTPDNQSVIMVSFDKSVYLWVLATGELITTPNNDLTCFLFASFVKATLFGGELWIASYEQYLGIGEPQICNPTRCKLITIHRIDIGLLSKGIHFKKINPKETRIKNDHTVQTVLFV